MSQTKQQEEGAAALKPAARKDWEWFWRIIAGLMLVVIAWVVWVLYQITPRSVVTPLAYASHVRPISAAPPAAGTVLSAVSATEAAAPPALPGTGSAATDGAMSAVQAAGQSGAHQASADAQAIGPEMKAEPVKGLRLATELSAPPADLPGAGKAEAGKPGSAAAVPAAAGAAAKVRP